MKLNHLQQVIIGVVLIVIVVAVAHFVALKSPRDRIRSVEAKNTQLEQDIKKALSIQKQAASLQEEMNHLKGQLERLKNVLPPKINKPRFLADIKRYANENGIEVIRASQNKSLKEEEVEEHPFTFVALGKYHDFGAFFAQLSDYSRIVNVKGLTLERNREASYTVNCTFIISVFTYTEPTPEELKKQLEAKRAEATGGKKKGPKGRRR